MIKKFILLLTVLILSIAVVSCNATAVPKDNNTNTGGGGGGNTEEPETPEEPEIPIDPKPDIPADLAACNVANADIDTAPMDQTSSADAPAYVSPLPERLLHTANRVGDKIYIFGGMSTANNTADNRLNDLWVFDMKENSIKKLSPNGDIPSKRARHASATASYMIYYFGGDEFDEANQGMPKFDFYSYNTTTNTFKKLPLSDIIKDATSGTGASLTFIGEDLYLYGGSTVGAPKGKLFKYSIKNNSWSEITYSNIDKGLNKGRYLHSSIAKKCEMYVGFGWDNDGDLKSIYKLNFGASPATQSQILGELPSVTAASSRDVFLFDEKICYVGGINYVNPLNLIACYDTLNDSFGNLKINNNQVNLPAPLFGHKVIKYGNKLFVIGGVTTSNKVTGDIYELNLNTGVWVKVEVKVK